MFVKEKMAQLELGSGYKIRLTLMQYAQHLGNTWAVSADIDGVDHQILNENVSDPAPSFGRPQPRAALWQPWRAGTVPVNVDARAHNFLVLVLWEWEEVTKVWHQ